MPPSRVSFEVSIHAEVLAHVLLVGFLILVATEVKAQFVDDLGPLANPLLPGFRADVLKDPRTNHATKWWLREFAARSTRSLANEGAGCLEALRCLSLIHI